MNQISIFMCPRIRLTKTDGSRAIIPIDAISGIEEEPHGKFVKVCTMDGFWYEVKNDIVDIDNRINEAIAAVNGHKQSSQETRDESAIVRNENSKVTRFKRKRMLSAGVDKPERRMESLTEAEQSSTPSASSESNGTTNKKAKGYASVIFQEQV